MSRRNPEIIFSRRVWQKRRAARLVVGSPMNLDKVEGSVPSFLQLGSLLAS